MNIEIEITRHQADQLRAILSDALASAERLAIHPDASESIVKRSQTVADVCLSIINKIVHQQSLGNIARAVLNERITEAFSPRTGLDR
jgi:hypothetical protein